MYKRQQALYSVKEEILEELEAFVKEGGVLVSSFKSFVSDEHFTVWHDTQPHRLCKCFGMSYNQFTCLLYTSVLFKVKRAYRFRKNRKNYEHSAYRTGGILASRS